MDRRKKKLKDSVTKHSHAHILSDDELHSTCCVDGTVANAYAVLKSDIHASTSTPQPLMITGSGAASALDNPALMYPYSDEKSTDGLPAYGLDVIKSVTPMAFVSTQAQDSLIQFEQYLLRLSALSVDARLKFEETITAHVNRRVRTREPVAGVFVLCYYIKNEEFLEVAFASSGEMHGFMFFSVK